MPNQMHSDCFVTASHGLKPLQLFIIRPCRVITGQRGDTFPKSTLSIQCLDLFEVNAIAYLSDAREKRHDSS